MMYSTQRVELLRTVQNLYRHGLIQISSGNVSMRVSDEHLLITPSSIPYDDLTVEQLVVITPHGEVVEGEYTPSSEMPMHTIIYRERPETGAVIHTHSLHALAFAAVGKSIPVITLEGLAAGGPVPVTEYACPGTEAQGWVALRAMQGPPAVQAVLLRNHGVLVAGPNLARAYSIAFQVEMSAQVYLMSTQLGQPVSLTDEQVAEIHAVYSTKKQVKVKA